MNDKKVIIDNIHDLINSLNDNYKKIFLYSDLYDWLLCSNWNCILSDKLKYYLAHGGIVERIEKS